MATWGRNWRYHGPEQLHSSGLCLSQTISPAW